MSQKSRAQLKAYLETNDVPTQAQYVDVVDSVPNFVDDNYTLPTFAVGTTTTLAPGEDATVVNSGTASAAVLDFGIPEGEKGDAATITVGTTTTGAPESPASVINSGTTSAAILDFSIPEGKKGETGDNATVDAGTTTTLAAGQSATVTNVGTTSAAIFNFAIPQGIQGLTGANGACVVSVSFVGNDMVFVLEDASTVTLTNAKTDLKGDTGAKIVSGAFVGDDLVFTLDDSSTATVTGAKTDLQGIQGIQGIQGVAGNGISNISLISTVGLVKTYRITYTDDTTFDYTVTDGADGTGIGDVNGPATNTDSYIPQWDGADSKTLKDGINPATLALKLDCVSKTADYTAQPFELVNCDVSAGSFKVTLPDAPTDKTVIYVKLNGIGTNKYLTIATSGTDKFNTSTGTVEIYMYLFGEFAQMQYCADSGLWTTFISAGTYNFATQNPGIDATTPITNSDIAIDTTARTLTINPPLGYFNIFTDGGGKITRYRKVGNVVFGDGSGTSGENTWSDTSGYWYFYLNADGQPVTTQTPWTADDFNSVVTIYRIIWNATLTGAAKLVAQYVEYHLNTISADDHKWKHLYGAIWETGFDIKSNAIPTGTPNTDGRNAVIALTTGRNLDDNLEYTVTNDSTPTNPWDQDMGDIVPATLNATNGGLFSIYTQDAGGLVSFLPATRFPFAWDVTTNRPQFITQTGTRTLVTDNRWFVYFVYATQNPVVGEAIKIVSSGAEYTSLVNARAVTWTDIQNTYPVLNDGEIRPIARIIFYNDNSGGGAFNVGTKFTAIREIQDIRKAQVTNTSTASGSLPASSVTVIPAGNIAATNVQSAIEELDTEKATISYADGKVEDNITDGHTTVAPSGNAVFDALALKAPLNSPTFTGTPSLPTGSTGVTQSANDNSTKLATTAYVDSKDSATLTLTNKKITKRVASTTDSATAAINSDSYDEYYLTAIANNTTISVTGTPTAGQTVFIGLKDAGTSKTLTWSSITGLGVTLPTATTAGKQHIIGLKYIASAWRAIAVSVEA